MTVATLRIPGTEVLLEDDHLVVEHLVVADRDVLALVGSVPAGERVEVVARALSVGARGLMTMGLGIDVASVDGRVRQTLVSVADEAERRIAMLDTAQQAFARQFDPEQRNSPPPRQWPSSPRPTGLLGRLDPALRSATTTFLTRLTDLVGRWRLERAWPKRSTQMTMDRRSSG
jgi:hypothetical protein